MSTLRIHALGRPRVLRDDTPLSFPTQKTRDLLCILLLHAGDILERDWIAERLWPMRSPGRARRCLSTTLWRLRRTVEKENWPQEQAYVRSERDTLTFERGTAHWFDVEVFERKASDGLEGSLPCDEARAQDLREALELYQGDLLEGCYDDWCLADRERLNLLLLRVLKKLQQHARLSGDFEMGKEYGERLLSLDSLQEDVHRELMRCYVDAGDPTRALEHFHRCREMLKAELQVEPMRETWRLYREIRADREGLVSTELETSPLTSLEAALVQFDRALVALRHVHEALRVAAAESGLAHGAASVPPVYPKRD